MTANPMFARAAQAVSAARTRLVLAHPFFGALALRLRLVPDPTCPTAWVDGIHLGYNPAWVLKISPHELVGVLAHEVLHVALGHPWRRGKRHQDRWNMACDHAINPLVAEAGMALPKGGLSYPDAKYPGMPAEVIYDRLPAIGQLPMPMGGSSGQAGAQGSQGGHGQGQGAQGGQGAQAQGVQGGAAQGGSPAQGDYGPGAVRDAPGDEAERASAWAQVQAAIMLAAHQARMMGRLPAGLERAVGEAVRPRLDWRALLRRWLQQAVSRQDYTWLLPNPRYTHLGAYLPTLRGEEAPVLLVAVDTSGSIRPEELDAFMAEVRAIHQELRPSTLHLWWADAEVAGREEYGPDDDLAPRPKGGGGTDFRPVFRAAEDLAVPPTAVVYLTDGDGTYPNKPSPLPTMWVITTDRVAPWGETIRMEVE